MTRFFIERPIFAWVISIVILLGGGVAYFTLPVAQYPNITPPTVQLTCSYPGANAKVVADTVAAPIEQQVNGVEGMMYMSSQCTNDGNYNLTITFNLGVDLNMAQVLVQNRVALAMPQLPEQVQIQGVNTQKKSPNILLCVNLISPDRRYDDLYLSNYATIQIQDELLRIPGVGAINYLGQRQYSMRMWLDPEKLATRNLTASDVVNAIQNQNVQVAAGNIGQQPVPKGQQYQLTMSTLGRLVDVEQFADIIIKTNEGNQTSGRMSSQVVRIRDVARIELGAQNYDQTCRLDGQPSVALAIMQLPGSNALNVADAVKMKMKELSKRFPEGVEYQIVYDTTPFIDQSVEEVIKTLRDAVILVAIVVLLFLQDWRAMILPMIDVPVALIGTFLVMSLIGFSLNNLTLFGLVLAIGIVVDDAIMVLENVERLMATGLDPKTATIKAMGELTGPIVAVTLVLCSVFLPGAFLGGITGQFFRQFAVTIAVSMIISAINAMTLTPSRAVTIFKHGETGGHGHQREALPWWIFAILGGLLSYELGQKFFPEHFHLPETGGASAKWFPWAVKAAWFAPGVVAGGVIGWFLIHPVNAVLGWLFRGFNRGFDRVTAMYGWTVGRALRLSVMVLLIYGGLLFLTGWGMGRMPTGFIPVQDQGYLLVNVQLPDSASVQRTQEVVEHIEKICLNTPGVAHTLSASGQSFVLSANAPNFASIFVILDDFDKRRSHDVYDAVIAQKLRVQCYKEIEDAVIGVFRAPPIQGLGNAGGFQLQVEQRGFVDLNELQETTTELVQACNDDQRLIGWFSLYRANTPQLYLDIDRTKCESMKVQLKDVFTTLQVYMGSLYVNNFNKFGRSWQVQVMADAPFRGQLEDIKLLKVRNLQGQMVPLATLLNVTDTGGPVMVMRYNMYYSAPVNGNVAPGTSSGEAIEIIQEKADKLGVTFEWTQITFLQIQEMGDIWNKLVFPLGAFLVFLVLAAKYESWKLPMAVILVVPMCLLCAIAGLAIAQMDISIFTQIGFIVLIGLAAKNAILIVEFAHQMQQEGKSRREATLEACRLRLRPIVMTSFAFILGVVPLILSHGAGAEMRVALGTAVFSGMIGVTLFGIFLTPVFYYVIMWFGERGKVEPKPVLAPVLSDGVSSVPATAIQDKAHVPETAIQDKPTRPHP